MALNYSVSVQYQCLNFAVYYLLGHIVSPQKRKTTYLIQIIIESLKDKYDKLHMNSFARIKDISTSAARATTHVEPCHKKHCAIQWADSKTNNIFKSTL